MLVAAGVAVVLVRVSLPVLPSRVLLRWVSRLVARAPDMAVNPAAARRIVRAVEAVSRWVPGASCLTQALAVQVLLALRGRRSVLRIGVAQDAERGFTAHAWVEVGGTVVVGGGDAHRHTALPDLSVRL